MPGRLFLHPDGMHLFAYARHDLVLNDTDEHLAVPQEG